MKSRYRAWAVAGVVLALLLSAFLANRFGRDNTHASSAVPTIEAVDASASSAYVYVDIKGEIKRPGVYKVEAGTRLYQLVSLAGGLTAAADASAVNLAVTLHDQSMVYIPASGETRSANENTDVGKISLTHGTLEHLVTLPNIGPATAAKIIDYRDEHGPFERIEDVMNVSGIGEATYQAIKPFVVP